MIRRGPIAFFVFVGGLLAGCSAHYRQAIEAFERQEATPYLQRTLTWTERADEAADGTMEGAAPLEPTEFEREIQDERAVWLEGVSDILVLDEAALERMVQHLEDPAALEQAIDERLRWEDLRVAVALHGPGIQAARCQWVATLHQYDQAQYLEDMITQFRAFTNGLKIETGKPLHRERQKDFFPYPGTIALKGELIREQVRLGELEWRRTLRDAVVRAGKLYFELQYLIRAEKTAREDLELFNSLIAVLEERYRTGAASQAELLKLQNERSRHEDLIRDFSSLANAARARINAALGRSEALPLGEPQSSTLAERPDGIETLMEDAQTGRQEVMLAEARVIRAQLAIRLGEVMNRPPASVAGMKPHPAYAQAESYLAEMRRRLEARELELREARAQTEGMGRDALERLDESRRQVALIEDVIQPQTQSIYETTLSDYVAGRSTFLDLLDAERKWVRTRLELHRAHRDLNLSILHLAMVRGRLSASEPDAP